MPAVFPFQEVLLNLVGFIHRHRIVFLICESTRVGIYFCFWLLVRLFVCLFVCLVGWLVDWLFGWLARFFFVVLILFFVDFWDNFLKGTFFLGGIFPCWVFTTPGYVKPSQMEALRGLGVNETSSSGSAGQRHCAG